MGFPSSKTEPMKAARLIADLTQRADLALSPDDELANLPGWDSLKTVRLVLQLEGALGRELEEAEVESLERLSDIERLLNGS